MRDELFAFQMAQSVLQLHQLDEQIMFGIEPGYGHWGLEVEAEPLLNAETFQFGAALSEVEEEDQIEHDGRGQDRIAAEEVDFDLHGIAEPSEDVDVVPAFFVVAARRVVVDADLVENISVEIRIERGLKDVLENSELRFFFGLERTG